MSGRWQVTTGMFELGVLEVERGGVIKDAKLSWQTHGTLNKARDNVIVYPCSYEATHKDLSWLIGPDLVLDPDRWFIIIPDMFSGGLSSSASHDRGFPAVVTMADNVRARLQQNRCGHGQAQQGTTERSLLAGSSTVPGQRCMRTGAQAPLRAQSRLKISCSTCSGSMSNSSAHSAMHSVYRR
jgi:homoserine acetyltransferase